MNFISFTDGAFLVPRTKSRMEEINELIARSQVRAQTMLASGAYSASPRPGSAADDPLRTLSPSRDYLNTSRDYLNTSIPLNLNTSGARCF